MSETREQAEQRDWGKHAANIKRRTDWLLGWGRGYDAGLAAGACPDEDLLEALKKLNNCSECGGSDGLCPFCGGTGKNNIADAALVKYSNKPEAADASNSLLEDALMDLERVDSDIPMPDILALVGSAKELLNRWLCSSQASEPKIESIVDALEPCPDCGSRRHKSCQASEPSPPASASGQAGDLWTSGRWAAKLGVKPGKFGE